MREMFDINLLSQVQALDRKFSISKEQSHLKRKSVDNDKHKGAHSDAGRNMKDNDHSKDDNFAKEKEDSQTNIDITI